MARGGSGPPGGLAQGLVRPWWLYRYRYESKTRCSGVGPTGLRASSFRVRWNRSRRPFCSGFRAGCVMTPGNQTARTQAAEGGAGEGRRRLQGQSASHLARGTRMVMSMAPGLLGEARHRDDVAGDRTYERLRSRRPAPVAARTPDISNAYGPVPMCPGLPLFPAVPSSIQRGRTAAGVVGER